MEKRNINLSGALLIVTGMLFLVFKFVCNLKLPNFDNLSFWPVFVIGPGLILECIFFTIRKWPVLLVPGGILTTIGLLFIFEAGTHSQFSSYTWPIYIISVAVGLFQLYFFGNRNVVAYITAFILTITAVVVMKITLFNSAIIPISFTLSFR